MLKNLKVTDIYSNFFCKSSMAVLSRPGIVDAGCPTRLPGAGLQHHQPMVHLLQDFLVNALCDVGQLVGVCRHVVDLYKHLQGAHIHTQCQPGRVNCQTVLSLPPDGTNVRHFLSHILALSHKFKHAFNVMPWQVPSFLNLLVMVTNKKTL